MAFRHIGTYSNYDENVQDGYCVHGTYVGGCGIDWMCGHCEMGEFDLGEQDMGTVHIMGTAVNGNTIDWYETPTTIERAEQSAKMWYDILSLVMAGMVIEVIPSVRNVWYNKSEEGE